MISPRLHCLVPGCRRTRGQRDGELPFECDEEWVCSVHWPMVRKDFRKVLASARRALGRTKSKHDAVYAAAIHEKRSNGHLSEITLRNFDATAIAWERSWSRFDRVWRRCRTDAIQRGVGI